MNADTQNTGILNHDIKDECLEPDAAEHAEAETDDDDYRESFRSECLDFAKSVAKTIVVTAAATATSLLVSLAFKKFLGK